MGFLVSVGIVGFLFLLVGYCATVSWGERGGRGYWSRGDWVMCVRLFYGHGFEHWG
jgi:hypothetical protein